MDLALKADIFLLCIILTFGKDVTKAGEPTVRGVRPKDWQGPVEPFRLWAPLNTSETVQYWFVLEEEVPLSKLHHILSLLCS